MSYSRKVKKRPDVEIYYTYGDSDNFQKFRGNKGWRFNKEIENFSNDRGFETDGEFKNNGAFFNKYFGIGKRRWRYDEDMIGVKK